MSLHSFLAIQINTIGLIEFLINQFETMINSDDTTYQKLSPRELEVITLLAVGLRKNEIAKKLGNKPSTVEKQIVSARKRLDCRSSCQAISKLIQMKQIVL